MTRYIKKTLFIFLFILLVIIAFTEIVSAEENTKVTVTASILNLREAPSTSAKVLDQLKKGDLLTFIESSNGWSKVSIHGITGWVLGKYVIKAEVVEETKKAGIITGDDVNVRKGAGLSYEVITKLDKGEKIVVSETSDGWCRIKTDNGVSGWVNSKYVSVNSETADQTSTEVSRGGEALGEQIVDYAKSLLGVKYVYGGTCPETGFDCSGFTRYVFEKFGIRLDRVAADQAKQGSEISQDQLIPGDLVFSDTNGGNNGINHVGIYIGDGKFINAASGSTSGKVVISSLSSSYWQAAYMTARRVI